MLGVKVKKRLGALSLDIEFKRSGPGVTAIFGPSGAGKTSLINIVAGISRPDEGHVIVNGKCLFDSSKKICEPPEARRIGYVFQDGRLFPHLSVKSNLTYGMKLTSAADRYVDYEQIIQLLDLEPLLSRRPAKLSGGEKQRVAIGRALLTSPRLLLMDEPLSSLDAARKEEVIPFIATICREFDLPIIYVSHMIDEISRLADKIVEINNGRVAPGKSSGHTEALYTLSKRYSEHASGCPIHAPRPE